MISCANDDIQAIHQSLILILLTAMDGDYYANVTRLEFGRTSSQTERFSVMVLVDNLLEGYETFSISLVNTTQNIQFTIEDIDGNAINPPHTCTHTHTTCA